MVGGCSLLKRFARVLPLVAALLSFSLAPALAQDDPATFWLKGDSQDVSAAMQVYLEQDGESLDATQILERTGQDTAQDPSFWQSNKKSWGYQNRAAWLKLKLGNPGDESRRVVLVTPYFAPMQLQISIYDQAGQLVRSLENGTMSPYEGRDLKLNRMGAYIDVPARETRMILIKQRTLALLDTHYVVRSLEVNQWFEWIYLGAYGVYFGLALALFFHNLSLFFSVRDRVYIAYLIFVMAVTSVIGFTSGFYGILWGNLRPSLQNSVMTLPGLATVAGAYLAYAFLHLDWKTSVFGKLFVAFGIFGLVCAPIQFLWPSRGVALIPIQSLGVGIIGVTACIAQMMKGQRYATFLLIAVLCPVSAIVAYFVGSSIFKINVPSDIISLGFATEMLLMSISLSHRIYSIKQEQHEKAALQAIQIHSLKMRALNDLAGGVAHEVNNPLMIINGYAEIIGQLNEGSSHQAMAVRSYSTKIMQTVERIAFIVQSLRSVSDNALAHSGQIHAVQNIIAQALVLSRARVESHDIQLELQVNAEPIAIEGQAAQVLQVIFALINNSIEALNGRSAKKITIEVCFPWRDRKDTVAIVISDNGPSLPKAIQEKLFQPFFTTKKHNEGTGLSLSHGQQIIEGLGGKLYLDTQASLTSFVIELPTLTPSSLQKAS